MIAIRSRLEIPSPSTQWIEGLPEGAELRVILRGHEVLAHTIEVEVRCKPEDVQAVRNTLAFLSVQATDAGVTVGFPDCDLKPKSPRLLNKGR